MTNEPINTGLSRFYLIGAIAFMGAAVLLNQSAEYRADSWIAFLGFFLFLHSAFKSQIYIDQHELRTRDTFLRWKSYRFDDLRNATFSLPGRAELRFVDDKVNLKDVAKKKIVLRRLKAIGRKRIPFFGYRHAYRDEMGHHEKCGCVACGSIFEREDIKRWKRLQIKFIGITLSKLKMVAICPSCAEEQVVRATDRSVPISREGLEAMKKNYISVSPEAHRSFILHLDSVRKLEKP